MNIQIRNVPDDLHRKLRVITVSKGSSIQQTLLRLIREYVELEGAKDDKPTSSGKSKS